MTAQQQNARTPMHPLIRRLLHACRQRDIHWDQMSEAAQRMMNKAVDACYKDAMNAGLMREARQAVDSWRDVAKELGVAQ